MNIQECHSPNQIWNLVYFCIVLKSQTKSTYENKTLYASIDIDIELVVIQCFCFNLPISIYSVFMHFYHIFIGKLSQFRNFIATLLPHYRIYNRHTFNKQFTIQWCNGYCVFFSSNIFNLIYSSAFYPIPLTFLGWFYSNVFGEASTMEMFRFCLILLICLCCLLFSFVFQTCTHWGQGGNHLRILLSIRQPLSKSQQSNMFASDNRMIANHLDNHQ